MYHVSGNRIIFNPHVFFIMTQRNWFNLLAMLHETAVSKKRLFDRVFPIVIDYHCASRNRPQYVNWRRIRIQTTNDCLFTDLFKFVSVHPIDTNVFLHSDVIDCLSGCYIKTNKFDSTLIHTCSSIAFRHKFWIPCWWTYDPFLACSVAACLIKHYRVITPKTRFILQSWFQQV